MAVVEPAANSPTQLDADRVVADADALMARVASDDTAAFQTLLQSHEGRLLGFASKYLGESALAEEAVQESFVRLWQSRDRYQPSGRFASYLTGICLNACRELSRSRRRRKQAMQRLIEQQPTEFVATSSGELMAQEQQVLLDRHIARLPGRLKEAILLRFLADMSYAEMAELLGRSEVTLRSRVFHALKKLRGSMQQEEP